jgi:translation initiation factor IF-3
MLGIMSTMQALQLAQEANLNLVEVNATAAPPVCKIMDYGKFKYENAKRDRDAKKSRKTQEVKEVKFRPKTHDHDFDFKVKHARRFLEEGDKVRLMIQFRGREITHPETGKAVMDRVVKALADVSIVAQVGQMEGNRMSLILQPKPNRGGGVRRPTDGAGPRPPGATAGDGSAAPGSITDESAPGAEDDLDDLDDDDDDFEDEDEDDGAEGTDEPA